MLLVRAVIGIALLGHGACYFNSPATTVTGLLVGSFSILAGALLVIGFLTPIVGVLVAIGAVCVGLSVLPSCALSPFDSVSSLTFGSALLLAIIALGPGAFSVDARVFGRREIILPPS